MNKSLTMRYYNALRQTNPALAKTKEGRSMIMDEAVWIADNMVFEESPLGVYIVGTIDNYNKNHRSSPEVFFAECEMGKFTHEELINNKYSAKVFYNTEENTLSMYNDLDNGSHMKSS